MYLEEFIIIAVYHLMAVASPGPDFAVTIRYSLSYGRRIGRWVSLGIGTGILLHVAYSVLGIALVIHRYQWVYASLLLLGASYLGWLGSQAIRSAPKGELEPGTAAPAGDFSAGKAFRIGFFTNGLNVKATLFFLVLFSTVIAPETPTSVKIGYGLYMAVATAVWFAGLATLINWPPLFRRLWRVSHWIDRVMGIALIALSLKLILDWLQLIEVLA